MNEKKICFISCVNNQLFYDECRHYIESLKVPYGYEVEILPVYQAKSMCEGYNTGMNLSDAKFKIYLHQDVYIINKNFVEEMLKIFLKNPNIGLLGVIGAEKLAFNAWWCGNPPEWGMVYDCTGENLHLALANDFTEEYKKVEAVDGLILMTQYDLRWREDIFDGWHFYDLSQCQEFIAKGYNVVVPYQQIPWCVHAWVIPGAKLDLIPFLNYQKKFIKEYSWEKAEGE